MDGEAYGLSFASKQEADALASVVQGTISELDHASEIKDEHAIPQDLDTSSPLQSDVTSANLKEVPPPRKFQLVRRAVSATDPGWHSIETQLKLTYPARLRSNVQVCSITELTREADAVEFANLYEEFGVSDLWLNVDKDALVDQVSRDGFAALGNEQLSFGIPLGTYLLDHDDICGDNKQMILCKVALGRSLPMTEASLNSLQEAPLPIGYHSFCIPPQEDSQRASSTFGNIPLGVFEHSFLVPNSSFVLMTHLVTFEVKTHQTLGKEPSMSLFQSHPSVLGDQYKDNILGLCDPAFKDQDDLTFAVDQSFEQMWTDINALGDTQADLQENLQVFQGHVDHFKESALDHCKQNKEATISYQSHAMEVNQSTKDFRFEVNRTLSDIMRLQELYLHMRDTSSAAHVVSSWTHLNTLSGNLKHEARQLSHSKAVHPHIMALTEKNKRVVGLRREAMLMDELIARLADLLQQKGALTPEDEELIALI